MNRFMFLCFLFCFLLSISLSSNTFCDKLLTFKSNDEKINGVHILYQLSMRVFDYSSKILVWTTDTISINDTSSILCKETGRMKNAKTAEKRDLQRVRCIYYLKVYELPAMKDIGSMIDITTKGMKIISEQSFETGKSYSFRIQLPQGYIYGDHFDVLAEVRWCNQNEDQKFYEAGFKFTTTPHKGIYVIKMLLQDFRHNNIL